MCIIKGISLHKTGKKVPSITISDCNISDNLHHYKLITYIDVRNIIKHGLKQAKVIKGPINQFAKA
jgi:hypothetical protein